MSTPNSQKKVATLYILGTPLSDRGTVDDLFRKRVAGCDLVIAESPRVAERLLRDLTLSESSQVVYLDNLPDREKNTLREMIRRGADNGLQVCLFSDTGMPILFDPGVEILQWARQSRYVIRSSPSATSWGSSAALSGFEPPFLLVGFPPQKTEDRDLFYEQHRKVGAHLILMDTPYRYRKVIEECTKVFGGERKIFLAWEIANFEEKLFWGTLGELASFSENNQMKKGEFVLIIGSPGKL